MEEKTFSPLTQMLRIESTFFIEVGEKKNHFQKFSGTKKKRMLPVAKIVASKQQYYLSLIFP